MPHQLTRRSFVASLAVPALAAGSLAEDAERPRYHFLPPSNWMNDPNGPIWHRGEYHLYYQYNPKAAQWDTMHWGHAVSSDLLHWKHLPIALAPTPGGPDKDGCFTGCMVVDNGKPTLIYTGVKPEVQCVATSDDLSTWTKHPRNPVIARPPEGLDSPGFRDPQVWREGAEWLLAIGAGARGKGGMVLLYSSPNLVDWTYQKPLLTGTMRANVKDPVGSGEMWECPDFFPVGNKHLLYVSTEDKVLYWLGTWKNRVFTPESNGVLVYGAGYAPKSSNASQGRRIIWAWLRERRDQAAQLKAGWSGAMSLAVVPTLAKDGTLQLQPAREYQQLRGKHQTGAPPEDCCEIHIELKGDQAFALNRGGVEVLGYDPQSRMLSAGRSEAQAPPGELDLRVFLDGSVVEVFANSKVWLTGRVYGPVRALAVTGTARKMESWALRPVSADRLTT